MINYLKVTNPKGESLTIDMRSPEKSGFFIRGIDGLGPSKSVVNMGESLYQDGSFFNSARVIRKNLVLDLGFYDYPGETIEEIRNKTYKYFPMKKEIFIEVQTDSRLGLISGYVESNEPTIFSKEEGAQISILCPSAYFVGSDYISTVFNGSTNDFSFPFENPSLTESLIVFGSIFINTQGTVVYNGDVDTGIYIIIKFSGAVTNPVISNTLTGENFSINSTKLAAIVGSNFQAGDLLVIDTIKNEKRATLTRANFRYNILNAVDVMSDWFQIQSGDNVFVYTASAGIANMQFEIQHQLIFEGL